jgi:hypothetical protein
VDPTGLLFKTIWWETNSCFRMLVGWQEKEIYSNVR